MHRPERGCLQWQVLDAHIAVVIVLGSVLCKALEGNVP